MGQFRFWLQIQQEQGKILDIIGIIISQLQIWNLIKANGLKNFINDY